MLSTGLMMLLNKILRSVVTILCLINLCQCHGDKCRVLQEQFSQLNHSFMELYRALATNTPKEKPKTSLRERAQYTVCEDLDGLKKHLLYERAQRQFLESALEDAMKRIDVLGQVCFKENESCRSEKLQNSQYPAIPTLDNGRVDCAGNTQTGICTFMCFGGYDLHGPTVRHWTRDRSFDGKDTSCRATTTTNHPATTANGVTQRSDILCTPTTMEIFIPVTILPRYNVTLRDPQCPVIFNGTHHVASVGLSQCGTTMQFTKTSVVFRNQLSARVTNAARSQSSRISFGDAGDLFIPVECEYPRRANVTMSYTPLHGSLRIFEKRFGHLHFQMRGFSDDTFQSEIPSTSLPMQVPLNEELHVMLSIDPSTVANIGIFADRCLATPSSSPNDPVFWSLLQNGCSMQPEVRVHRSPSLTEFRFSFNAFKFMSTDPSGSPSLVYVHCQVSVCRQHDCVTSCQGHSRSRRRRSASHHASHLVSTGPFILMKDNSGTGSSQSSIPLSLGVVASSCVAVVACLVAVVATVAWKRSKGKERTTQEPIN